MVDLDLLGEITNSYYSGSTASIIRVDLHHTVSSGQMSSGLCHLKVF